MRAGGIRNRRTNDARRRQRGPGCAFRRNTRQQFSSSPVNRLAERRCGDKTAEPVSARPRHGPGPHRRVRRTRTKQSVKLATTPIWAFTNDVALPVFEDRNGPQPCGIDFRRKSKHGGSIFTAETLIASVIGIRITRFRGCN